MNKIKLLARQLDGTTLVEQAPDFQLVEGWTQATLPSPAGVLPAGLWGKVPGGDPYLLHVNVLTPNKLAVGDPLPAVITLGQPRLSASLGSDGRLRVMARSTGQVLLLPRCTPATATK